MGDYDWALWLGLAVVLGLVEVTTLDLTFLMISAGAVAAAGAAGIGLPFALQAVIAIAVAIERVDANGGQVKLKGEVWSARTYDPHVVIEAGRNVEVVQIDGATAIVYESEL